jgi:hypothetical protein
MNKLLSINGARIVLCLLMVSVMASMATSIVKLRTHEEIGRIELPHEAFEEAVRIYRPGGTIFVETPSDRAVR